MVSLKETEQPQTPATPTPPAKTISQHGRTCPTCGKTMSSRVRGGGLLGLVAGVVVILVANQIIRESLAGPPAGVAYLVALGAFFAVQVGVNSLLRVYKCEGCGKVDT